MTRITDTGMTIWTSNITTALNRFFKKNEELESWRGELEWMAENNVDFLCSNEYNDGTRNKDWTFALHLDIEADYIYIGIIERE